MLFSRFKTSTRTALIVTLFTSVLLVTFVIILNVYYFYNWRLDERNETIDKTNQLAAQVLGRTNGSGSYSVESMSRFFGKILEQ